MALAVHRNGTSEIEREPIGDRGRALPFATRRRHSRFPATSVSDQSGADYGEEQIQFLRAIDAYKRDNRRPFPAWDEVLAVAISLGYRKVAATEPPPVFRAEV